MQHFEAAAIAAAREAGALIRQRLGAYAQLDTKASARDLVTDVDRESERIIARRLLGEFPEHTFLGEEGVSGAVDQDVEYAWIVDPIDGTMNFVHGIPAVTVSIALARRGELVVGVVYDMMRDELFHARRGEGAFLNGEAVRVSPERDFGNSVLASGFSVIDEWRRIDVAAMTTFLERCRNIRLMGSAALHLAYVAAGRLQGFWEHQLNAWDISAGALLVREAGGRVTNTAGAEWSLADRHVAASNGAIHEQMIEVLKGQGAHGR